METPKNFGFFWEKVESNLDWYDWMFHYRLQVHRKFLDWLQNEEAGGGRFDRVLEVGCGRGVFYPHYFSDRRYTGLEYSRRNTDWLVEHREFEGHEYFNGDIVNWEDTEKFDLVFSSGTIDNVPDMDRFLEGMVCRSQRMIYLTAYRGWFPELDEHRISWEEQTGAFYNDISPVRVMQVLNKLGCTNILIEPLATGRDEIPYETLISARVPS